MQGSCRNTGVSVRLFPRLTFTSKHGLELLRGAAPRLLALLLHLWGLRPRSEPGRGARHAGIVSFAAHFRVVQTSKQLQNNLTTRKCPSPRKIHCVLTVCQHPRGCPEPSVWRARPLRAPCPEGTQDSTGSRSDQGVCQAEGSCEQPPAAARAGAGWENQDLLVELRTLW